MTKLMRKVGIVGGSGMLGRAIAKGLLDGQVVAPQDLWISNRSGRQNVAELPSTVNFTANNQQLADACEVIILSVPPANLLEITIDARDRLIISVMAGVTTNQLSNISGASRVVRAMSSPAAATGLAFSPWFASRDVTLHDRACVNSLFEACGATAEVTIEGQIDSFTAITGPVPGFVAFFAECMVNYAIESGISEAVANRAIRQLFLAAGRMMADSSATPAQQVEEMIDYAGTTAAGLISMKDSSIQKNISDGLNAAVERARTIC